MRLLKIVLLVLLAIPLLGVAGVYGYSEMLLRERHRVSAPAFTTPIPTDSASLAEGERIARTRGCFGCHGEQLTGEEFFSQPYVATIFSVNLTKLSHERSAAQMERTLRHGVRPDGTSLMSMPSEMFRSLTDADLARLIGYLQSLPPLAGEERTSRMGPLARFGMVTGDFQSSVYYIKSETPLPPPQDSSLALGHYLAISSCTECHAGSLRGDGGSPSLPAVLAMYTDKEFVAFARSGVAKGGRELRMMSGVARGRLSHFTDEELVGIWRYLRSLDAGP